MSFLVQLILAACLINAIHLLGFVVAARVFGVRVVTVAYGVGPVLWRKGPLEIRAIPLGGHVKFRDTQTEGGEDEEERERPVHDGTTEDAFNCKPRWVQAVMTLGGSVMVIALASATIGGRLALHETLAGFRQLFLGAMGPLSTAQEYIGALHAATRTEGFLVLLGVIAAKFAAFNLLPIPPLNGGQFILAFLRPTRYETPHWHNSLVQWTFSLMTIWLVAWLVAIVRYFMIHH